jgi:hypothetical protein
MEIIHHAVAAKLLQHSAITPALTHGAIIGVGVETVSEYYGTSFPRA